MSEEIRILIIGGVAGGASAATRARRMNERAAIVLLEKDRDVSFANCGLPYYIGGEIEKREALLVTTAEALARRFRIDVRARHEVLEFDRAHKRVTVLERETGRRYEEAYDKLIVATGAEPIRPPIEGAVAEGVFTLRNLEDADALRSLVSESPPRRAVVIGAGFIGLEMVEQLVGLGIPTSLVELQDQVLPPLDPEMARPLEEELLARGVDLHLSDGIARIETADGRATGVTLASGKRVEGELVLLGIGVRPSLGLAEAAGIERGPAGGLRVNPVHQTSDPDVYAVGDVVEYRCGPGETTRRVALAGPANRAGRIAGQHAASGRADPAARVFGTAIVRCFSRSAGMTGLSRKEALRSGIEAASVTIVARHHAGYFPGAKPLTLKLVYAPADGRVLGAQAVGEEGVDKRLDVIATAMAFDATVRDLSGLDLAYAPPFGAAKDPVHMAAFAACNDLDGLVRFLQPDAELGDYEVVDVRSRKEASRQPLAGAPHVRVIPLDELRDRLDELDRERPVVVSCQTGQRGYAAARILSQHGFGEVYDLTGSATIRARALRGEGRG